MRDKRLEAILVTRCGADLCRGENALRVIPLFDGAEHVFPHQQKELIVGLIEQALEEAEEEFEAAEAAGREEQEESAWDAAQGGETGEGDDPSTGLPSEYAAWSAPQEDEQEAADEAEDVDETEDAEEEIYA